ncbi:MAG TPA: V-type ATP synthase subunit K [Clostridiales bacterium]|nr:V-type ATP synthase subunit K [Clostridiales bacterium]
MQIFISLLASLFVLGTVAGIFFAGLADGVGLALLGAATAVALAGTGSALGVGIAAEAAAGVTAEDPDKFGRLLLLQALPGTQGFYGLITAFLVMNRLGFFAGEVADLSLATGLQFFLACLPTAIAGFLSAYFQGRVAVAGINLVAKRPDQSGKALIMTGLVETYAVLGLLISILMIFGIRI